MKLLIHILKIISLTLVCVSFGVAVIFKANFLLDYFLYLLSAWMFFAFVDNYKKDTKQ